MRFRARTLDIISAAKIIIRSGAWGAISFIYVVKKKERQLRHRLIAFKNSYGGSESNKVYLESPLL